MSHPHNDLRDHLVQKSRVSHIAHRASGGRVHDDDAEDRTLIKGMVKPSAMKVEGKKAGGRIDKRARGGRTKHKGTNVNVVVAPQGGGDKTPVPVPVPGGGGPPGGMPVRPPMLPPPGGGGMPPGVGGGGPPPGGMPGGPPMMHSRGGRAYKSGGRVGPAFDEGRRNGTQVSHSPGKNDGKDIGRGKPITYATGGAVEAPKGKAGMGPNMRAGGKSGLGRLRKAHAAAASDDGMAP